MQENLICPYPGLRPFNEEEAIFFKGREEHIDQIVKQLEEKKFMMLTGASGDGKSSLVYAGLIPNARAGFFKAKFNNWIVADFRPERDPLINMATAISKHLNLGDHKKVEKEFSYGFSALADTYKSSTYWVDQNSDSFKLLTAEEQKKAKRKGSNLLILVDQFEEFFTNPENYIHGKTSLESQTVVNLLLETTRLAIEQDLPIYIICTMRSDYIGQCASFRGLPEYIGYSQFFVPRLKRKEIYQVIEEPALLNGNKISKRLVEMLINEMNDGIDQLPVLQHALNQIWQKANKGKLEMDLIHFAMINGIPRNQLSEVDKVQFDKWFENLPEFKKQFFKRSSLGDVLDAHANELYETANHGIEDIITTKDAKLIVKTTFKCLTKIDESRAVRNRMTLEEVTQIINQPHINIKAVSHILISFRLQGNTFLKPFISENSARKELSGETVLDITHESLIRNWDKLNYWANQEHEHHLTWQDFHKQLQRWIKSEKSSGYLLPIGPLTFFDTWFNKVKINKYWLARYDDREVSRAQKLMDAEITLEDTKQFIRRSARRLFFSRTVIKYGADKLIAAFAILLFLGSCTYFYFDYTKKQNDYVVEDLQAKSGELLRSKYIKNKVKAEYMLVAERLKPGSYKKLLNNIDSDSSKIEVVSEMLANCLNYQENKKEKEPDNPLLRTLFLEQLSLIESKKVFSSPAILIQNINSILSTIYCQIILRRNNFQVNDDGAYQKFCEKTHRSFLNLLRDTSELRKIEIEKFNKLLQAMPEIVDYDSLELTRISDLLSPYNSKTKNIFDLLYPKDKTVEQSWNRSTITHNSGYYQLANLYTLTNDFKKLNSCFDSIIKYNKNFLIVTYGYSYNRLLSDLIITNKLFSKEGQEFLKKMESKFITKKNFPIGILLLNSLLTDKHDVETWTIKQMKDQSPYDLQLQWEKISYDKLNELTDQIIDNTTKENKLSTDRVLYDIDGNEKVIKGSSNFDEKYFLIALLSKSKAFANNKKENFNLTFIEENLKKAIYYYEKISSEYLTGEVNIGENNNVKITQRSKIFEYGGVVSLTNGWQPFHPYYLNGYKDKSIFINYVFQHKNLSNFYFKNDESADVLNTFLLNYFSVFDNKTEKVMNLKPIEDAIAKNSLHKKIDKDALLAAITIYYYNIKDTISAERYSKQINFRTFLKKDKINKDQSANYYTLAKGLLNYYLEQPFKPNAFGTDGMEDNGILRSNYDSAFSLLNTFPDAYQKRNAILINIDSLQRSNKYEQVISLMDTLINTYISKSPKFGNKLFEIFGRLATKNADNLAVFFMKDKSDKMKPECLKLFVSGKAQSGNYYMANSFIPEYVSSSSQLSLYTSILREELIKRKTKMEDGWSAMDDVQDENNWSSGSYENDENSNMWVPAGD